MCMSGSQKPLPSTVASLVTHTSAPSPSAPVFDTTSNDTTNACEQIVYLHGLRMMSIIRSKLKCENKICFQMGSNLTMVHTFESIVISLMSIWAQNSSCHNYICWFLWFIKNLAVCTEPHGINNVPLHACIQRAYHGSWKMFMGPGDYTKYSRNVEGPDQADISSLAMQGPTVMVLH